MAKKDKNSLLNIHYSRTLTPDNLSKATNYVGEYVLKGLGAFGKFLNAGFTSPTYGTTGQVSYARNAEDARRQRKLYEASELAAGKAMTWVSPLNYGAALVTGNGLNARKGEEEVASWSPAWLAVGRLGELYVGPKAVKGVKATPRVVVNTAAKVGVKPAKAAVVAREIKLATKKGVQSLEKLQPKVRTHYGDVEIDNPQLAYRQGNGIIEDFLKTGKVRTPDQEGYGDIVVDDPKLGRFNFGKDFDEPMFALGRLWYGLPRTNTGDLLVTAEPLALANKYSSRIKSSTNGTLDVRYAGFDNGKIRSRRVLTHEGLLTPETTTAYKWVPEYGYRKVTQEPSTSLAFFERPTLSNAQELAGATKWERNFKPKWHVANYPGYLLKGLMKGSLLEKQLSKNGTININLLNAYFNKASQLEREIANKVLSEKFAGLKTIDYNLFKKAVLGELINYSTKPQMRYSTYGMDRLGFNVIKESDGAGGIVEYLPGIRTNTFTFESPKLSVGSNKHYDTTTLGHSRTYTTPDEPNILHVMESLSDWGQSHVKMMPSVLAHRIAIEKALKSGNINAFHSFTNRLSSLMRDKLTKYERMALENINKEIESGLPSGFLTIEDLWNKKYEILKKASNRSNIGVLGLHLHDNYLLRQLQENLKYAAENGLTKMRYPTSETAAKIEGYLKNVLARTPEEEAEMLNLFKEETTLRSENPNSPRLKEISDRMNEIGNNAKRTYSPEHQTILKKYADFPKLFLKLFKDLKVRTVTDAKGNTWYEVDVPKGYLSREWQFKQGGKMNIIELFKEGGKVRKMLTASGGPLVNESTRVEKPVILPKKISKSQLSDDNSWEETDTSKVHVYPNLRNDKYVQEFFLYDYAPRFKRLNSFASQNYVNAALNIYKNTPIKVYNGNNDVGGYKIGGERRTYNNFVTRLANTSYIPSSVYLNEYYKMNRPTLVHELTHAYRLGYLGITGDARFSSAKRPIYNMINKEIGNEYSGSGYSNSEKDILNNTYDMEGYKIDYDPLYEKGTTNTEVRFKLWKELYDQLGRRPSLEETDRYIKTYNGEKLKKIIRETNAYGQTMYDNGMLTNLIRNALINVAQNNSNNTYLLNDQTYYAKRGGKMNILEFLKNGSGIHIKKKNRGKFTSYCGGKVTDECIRKAKASGNPTLVKRATFALNARRWKHKSGGIIKAEDGLSTSLLGLLPGVGTYQDYKEFEKNPNWKTGLSLGVSALGDAAMLTGAGTLIKGISAANKAKKVLGTAGKAANIARQLVWNQASKLKRESDAVNSLTLMNAPTNKILERLASKNLAKKFYEEALKNDEAALKVYLTAANNPALSFKSFQFTPLIYTNPGFHTTSQVIKYKKEGGIIKALEGTKTTFGLKILNILGNDTVKTIGSGLFNMLSNYNASSSYNNAIDNRIKALEKYKTYNDNLILDWALLKAEEELKSLFDLQLYAFNSGMSFENPSSIVFEHKKRQLANNYALKAKSLNDIEYLSKVANLESLKLNLTSEIFNGLINTGINAYANKALNPNGTPSKTTTNTTTTPNNNILKTGYEPYKSGYVDLFGNISTGMGFKFDKNFNVVPFDKSFNYQPSKLNV